LALLALVILAAAAVFALTQPRLTRKYAVPTETVPLPSGPVALAYGQHVATISGCLDCHGNNGSGRVFFESTIVGRFVAVNLTAGNGGVGGSLSEQDWVRAVRHGVRPDGTSLLAMPSKEFFPMSDADLGAVIAYMKTLPPVDNPLPESRVSFIGRVLMIVLKDLPLLPAELIDHNAPRPTAPQPGVTKEYGAYLATRCMGCHGDMLSGGHIPGTPPDWPPAANLTPEPGASIAVWAESDFIFAMRTGNTPGGKHLDAKYMPWPVLGQMTDEELKALWIFLRSTPARPTGNR
jgi:mono/diheme cytochrome c family protein